VSNPWLLGAWGTYPVVDPQAVDDEVVAKEYLTGLKHREEARHPRMEIEAKVLHGSVVAELRELSTDAQLIVVGAGLPSARGRSGVLGAHLAAHARCPVAVVRSDPDRPTPPEAPIVVGVDGSPAAESAAGVAAREAWMRGRTLVLVHARPTSTDPLEHGGAQPGPAADLEDRRNQAAVRLQRSLQADNPGLEIRLELLDGDPAHVLVEVARDAALLVVGTRGLGSFRGMLLGSVSSDVARSASCPVLVVRDGS